MSYERSPRPLVSTTIGTSPSACASRSRDDWEVNVSSIWARKVMQWILVWEYLFDTGQVSMATQYSSAQTPHGALDTTLQKKTACGPSLRQPARRCSDVYACAVALASSSKLTSLSVTLALLSTKSTTLASTTYASISARRCWFE